MRLCLAAALVVLASGCDLNQNGDQVIDAGAPTAAHVGGDSSPLVDSGKDANDGEAITDAGADVDAGFDAGALVLGVTGDTKYAGQVATVLASGDDGDAGAITYAWSVASTPPGSHVTTAAIQNASSASAKIPTDVAGAYELTAIATAPGFPAATATATVTALAAPVFFARTVLNSSGGVLDVHVEGHDGTGPHAVACPSTFDGPQAQQARLRTMITGASDLDVWEGPPGQRSRFVFAGAQSLYTDDAGDYPLTLLAGTDQSSCTSSPTVLRSLNGPVGALGQPRFSPAGARVAFLEPLAQGFGVATIGVDGSGYRSIAPVYATPPSDGGADQSVSIRPEWQDETHVVWTRPDGAGGWSIVVAQDAASATPTTLMTCTGSTPFHVVLLAGSRFLLAYAPTQLAATDLFVLQPDAGGACSVVHQLTALPGGSASRAHDYALSPDGATVAFLLYDATQNGDAAAQGNEGVLVTAPVDGSSAPSPLGAPTVGRIGPRWIAGGTHLAWTRAGTPADGGDARFADDVTVLLADGGGAIDLATGDGVSTIVAGAGPGGSSQGGCSIARASGPFAAFASLVVAALLLARTRASRRRRDD